MMEKSVWKSTLQLATHRQSGGEAVPIFCLYPQALSQQTRRIKAHLPNPFYAVKANTLSSVLDCIVAEGVHHFDVASMLELHTVLKADKAAVCAFMNPVKSETDIGDAYKLGVRSFAIDSLDELEKTLRATEGGAGCTLIVRMALAPKQSEYDMTGKFGASQAEAIVLLQRIAAMGIPGGLTFHVGSQCEHPASFVEAMEEAAQVARLAGAALAVLDVGGGFPAGYRGIEPPLALFGQVIAETFARLSSAFGPDCTLQCEPGRSLVAEAGSALVRVQLRRGNTLFLNDGLHGLLSDLRWLPRFHPVRRVSEAEFESQQGPLTGFSLAGPTCDSGDYMRGPYFLPHDVDAGDWIEIGFLGAYCLELVTPFNGFGNYDIETIEGVPSWHSAGTNPVN